MKKRKLVRYDRSSDLYEVLGIHASASAEDIQRAFRQRAKEIHPDRNPERVAWATEQFRRLNEAHNILSDPLLRAEYDRQRGWHHPTGTPIWSRNNPADNTSVPGDDWWNRPQAPPRDPPPPAPDFAPFANRRGEDAAILQGLLNGPYRYIFATLALIIIANVVFVLATQAQINAASAQRQTQTSRVSTLQAQSSFVVSTPSPQAAPALEPDCSDLEVTITEPRPRAEINFEAFNIRGPAAPEHFAAYTIER